MSSPCASSQPGASWAAVIPLAAARQGLVLQPPFEDRVLVLESGDRGDGVSAANIVRADVAQTEILGLAFPDQVADGASDLLDGHVGIGDVLVEQVIVVCLR